MRSTYGETTLTKAHYVMFITGKAGRIVPKHRQKSLVVFGNAKMMTICPTRGAASAECFGHLQTAAQQKMT